MWMRSANSSSLVIFTITNQQSAKGRTSSTISCTRRSLSPFRSHPEAAAEPLLPEGPNAGYLVVKSGRDEEDDEQTMSSRCGTARTKKPYVVFVPVPDQPLASNRYYVGSAAKGSRRKGLVELRSRQLAGPVGKWYCPFFLIREHDVQPRKQVDRSALYEVVLEQRWEPVRGDAVRHGRDISKVASTSRKVLIGGSVGARSEAARSWHDGAYVASTGERVGVCTTVWERMLWEQSRGGWVDEEKEAGSMAIGLVLVERFVVKRMDRSEVVAFDFVHHDKVKLEQGCS